MALSSLGAGCALPPAADLVWPPGQTETAALASATETPWPVATASREDATRPLVVAVRAEAASLDPHQDDYEYSQKAQHGAYEALLRYVMKEGRAEVGPALATGYRTEDARVWTLSLQKGVKFADGTPFNAEAVKYNLERVRGLKLPPASRLPQDLAVDVVDELTVRMTLKSANPLLADYLTRLYMVSPTAAKSHATSDDPWGGKWLSENTVGTGPYKVDGWVKGQTITMSRNPDYWGGWSGNHADRIILRLVRDAATRRLLLETGDVDLSEAIAIDGLEGLRSVGGVIVKGFEQPSLVGMMLRLKGPLKSAKVRQAIQLAFDYDGFIKGVLNGGASPARGPLPSPIWTWDSSLPAFKQDLAAARKLLADAGYASGGFSVQIATISAYGWFQPRQAQMLQANLKELGITATIQDYSDPAAYEAAITSPDKGPDVYAWTFNYQFNDPEDSLRRTYHSKMTPEAGGANYTRYSNPQVDALLDKGVTLIKREDRLPVYREVQKILVEDAVAIFSAQPTYFVTMRDTLQGYTWNPFSSSISYEWYDLWLSK